MTPYRTPAEGETGLSSAEIRIGIDIGVIADRQSLARRQVIVHVHSTRPAIRNRVRSLMQAGRIRSAAC